MLLLSCATHQKLMKSNDMEAKYAAAMDYYEEKDYYRALQLFQQLINFYKGTDKAEKLQFYFAYAYYHEEDYVLASYYFKRFTQNFPRSQYAEEAFFLSAYCYYLDSPKPSLDQTNTIAAINELQLFIDLYPQSEKVEESTRLIEQLRAKLQIKDFEIGKLYYDMGLYEAAITSFEILLREYPDTGYKEASLFYILKSYYDYAGKSVLSKKAERYQQALDSYNELVFQFPQTEYLKEASNIQKNILKQIQDIN